MRAWSNKGGLNERVSQARAWLSKSVVNKGAVNEGRSSKRVVE